MSFVVKPLLNERALSAGLDALVDHIVDSFRVIGTNLRNGDYTAEKAGTQNTFGDHQLHVDIETDAGWTAHELLQLFTCTNANK